MKVLVIAVNYNEEDLLPHFLRHYSEIADKIIIYDGGSTDRSLEIISQCPKAEVVSVPSEQMYERKLLDIRNEEYKKYKDEYDWVIVCDIDEFVYDPDFRGKLEIYKVSKINMVAIEGYQMVAMDFPTSTDIPIYGQVNKGYLDQQHLNKFMIFDPKTVDIRYDPGCHTARPQGPYIRFAPLRMLLLHYKYVGYEKFIKKAAAAWARMSQENKDRHWAFHYETESKLTREEFFQQYISKGQPIISTNRSYLDTPDNHGLYQEIFGWNLYNATTEDLANKIVLDAGGNFGFFSLFAIDHGATQVIAYEPNASNYEIFLKNTKPYANIKGHNKAIYTTTGDRVFLDKETVFTQVSETGSRSAETITLHDVLKEFPEGDNHVLKIDVEGAEHEIFYSSSKEDIRRFDCILIEIHGEKICGKNIELLEQHIIDLGYEMTWKCRNTFTDAQGVTTTNMDVAVYKFIRIEDHI